MPIKGEPVKAEYLGWGAYDMPIIFEFEKGLTKKPHIEYHMLTVQLGAPTFKRFFVEIRKNAFLNCLG